MSYRARGLGPSPLIKLRVVGAGRERALTKSHRPHRFWFDPTLKWRLWNKGGAARGGAAAHPSRSNAPLPAPAQATASRQQYNDARLYREPANGLCQFSPLL
jgi:hypothetical protein